MDRVSEKDCKKWAEHLDAQIRTLVGSFEVLSVVFGELVRALESDGAGRYGRMLDQLLSVTAHEAAIRCVNGTDDAEVRVAQRLIMLRVREVLLAGGGAPGRAAEPDDRAEPS